MFLLPIGFHSSTLLGILSPSIHITWPSQAILLHLHISLYLRFLLGRSVRDSFYIYVIILCKIIYNALCIVCLWFTCVPMSISNF
jgi:hypothetical protein